MNSNCFCTIITKSHLHYARALGESLQDFGNDPLYIFIVDDKEEISSNLINNVLYLRDLNYKIGSQIIKKYSQNPDKLRWCLKPVAIKYLIEEKGFERVIFLDPDLFFYQDYSFLFEKLESSHAIITPHWRNFSPEINNGFLENFSKGQYNAGFVGVSADGIGIVDWWASACLFNCLKYPSLGLYDDQKYLDAIPVFFPKIEILRHQGCNVAFWNIDMCVRTVVEDEIKINNKFPIVFIHFTKSTIRAILFGKDKILLEHLLKYESTLKKYKEGFTLQNIEPDRRIDEKLKTFLYKKIDSLILRLK